MNKLEKFLYHISYKGEFEKRLKRYEDKKEAILNLSEEEFGCEYVKAMVDKVLNLSEEEFECEYVKAMVDEVKAKLIILGTVATIIFAMLTDLGKIFFKILFELEKQRILEEKSLATDNMLYFLKGFGITIFCIILLLLYFLLKESTKKINKAIIYRQIKEKYK